MKSETSNSKAPDDMFQIMRNKPWLEHWMRVNRIYKLVKSVELGELCDEKLSECKFDLFLCFFTLCYHLRDWLVNSKSLKSNVVDAFIQSSYQLGICRNLCLGIKHHTITKPSNAWLADFSTSIGIKMPIVREYDYFSETKESTKILVDGKNYDALTLATECLEQWMDFLHKNNLL